MGNRLGGANKVDGPTDVPKQGTRLIQGRNSNFQVVSGRQGNQMIGACDNRGTLDMPLAQ
ncbi:hypothetical protein ACTXGQ_02330 [Marinobacter sp. 1Y8]